MPQLTAWFESGESPARPGVYERRSPAGPFSCWDGERWRRDVKSAAAAARQRTGSALQQSPWRGRVEPADAPCATCRGHGLIDRGVDPEGGQDLIEECPEC